MLEFYNSTRATSTESLNSTCVFFNRKMQKKGEKVVIRQQDTLLERLGYNVNDPDYIYVKDVVEEVIEGMNSRSEEEMRELVHNRSSYIYLESACFYFEIGLNRFNSSLDNLHNNKRSANEKAQKMIFGNHQDPTLEDTIFAVSKFIADEKKQTVSRPMGKRMVLTMSK